MYSTTNVAGSKSSKLHTFSSHFQNFSVVCKFQTAFTAQAQRRKGSTPRPGSVGEEKVTECQQNQVMLNALLYNEALKVVDTATQVSVFVSYIN